MPKIKIAIEVDVKSAAIPRWLGLEGHELLDAVKTAADAGDDVTYKVQPAARQGRILPLSTPSMFTASDFYVSGSRDDPR